MSKKIFSLLNEFQKKKIGNIWLKFQNLKDNGNVVFYKQIFRDLEKDGFKNFYYRNYDWTRLMIYFGRFLQLLDDSNCEYYIKFNTFRSSDIKTTFHNLVFYLSPVLRYEMNVFTEDNIISFKTDLLEI